jgi:hypothetical protein
VGARCCRPAHQSYLAPITGNMKSRLPTLAEGITLSEQVDLTRAPLLRSAVPGLIRSAPVRLNPVYPRAVCTAATPAERRAGRWLELDSGRDQAGHRHHQRACPGPTTAPRSCGRARAAHSPLGGSGWPTSDGTPAPAGTESWGQPGPAAALWLRTAARLCGAGGPIGPAVAGGFAREGARVSSVPGRSLQVPQLRRGRWSRPCWAGARRRPGCGLVAMTPSTVARRVCEQCS